MSDKYILDADHNVIGPVTTMQWAEWFETASRVVDKTRIVGLFPPRSCEVSTVFLGLDHRWQDTGGPPLVFETLIFGGPRDQDMRRCYTWDEAVAQHEAMSKDALKPYDDDDEDGQDWDEGQEQEDTEEASTPDDLTPEQRDALDD